MVVLTILKNIVHLSNSPFSIEIWNSAMTWGLFVNPWLFCKKASKEIISFAMQAKDGFKKIWHCSCVSGIGQLCQCSGVYSNVKWRKWCFGLDWWSSGWSTSGASRANHWALGAKWRYCWYTWKNVQVQMSRKYHLLSHHLQCKFGLLNFRCHLQHVRHSKSVVTQEKSKIKELSLLGFPAGL